MRQIEVLAHKPRYILRLDDLPKCIEADGRVWPIYLSTNEAARLFHVDARVIGNWIKTYDLPAVKVGPRMFISVPDLNDWLLAHAATRGEETEDEEVD